MMTGGGDAISFVVAQYTKYCSSPFLFARATQSTPVVKMTRGNQRDRDREKALKAKAKQKTANTLSGSEFQRAKENNAAIMRAKQAAADARKAAEAAAARKKK